jgi:hypothetical protein
VSEPTFPQEIKLIKVPKVKGMMSDEASKGVFPVALEIGPVLFKLRIDEAELTQQNPHQKYRCNFLCK